MIQYRIFLFASLHFHKILKSYLTNKNEKNEQN